MDGACLIYDALAALLHYPDEDHDERLTQCRAVLVNVPEAGALLDRFVREIESRPGTHLEELFTHTFDLDPICSLEVGWHLYGENYSRGEFLVTMRQLMRRHGIEETTDLPDHLSHVLAVLSRLPPREADRFTMDQVLPALEKMLAGLRGKTSPYEHLLEAIRCVLLSPCGAAAAGQAFQPAASCRQAEKPASEGLESVP